MRTSRGVAVGLAVLLSAGAVGLGTGRAEPASARSGIDWGKVWRTQIRPRADQRYETKAAAAKEFAPMPHVLRGVFAVSGNYATAGDQVASSISYGWSLGATPAVHVIGVGGLVPSGCSGTVTAPGAAPGNLCVFVGSQTANVAAVTACDAAGACGSNASRFGASLRATANGAGGVLVDGSWAASPAHHVSASRAPAAGSSGGSRR
jgi:hypothetical protein